MVNHHDRLEDLVGDDFVLCTQSAPSRNEEKPRKRTLAPAIQRVRQKVRMKGNARLVVAQESEPEGVTEGCL